MSNNTLNNDNLLKGLSRMAGPLLVAAIFQTLQGFIDLFWVGRLGSDAVAALSVSGAVLMTLFPVIMGISTGTIAFVSRSIGAGKPEDAAEAAGQSLVLATALGIVAGIIGAVFAEKFCLLLGANPHVAHLGGQYMQIIFLGSFILFVLFMGNSVFQAQGNTALPMTAAILATIINATLDPILIYGRLGFPQFGVRGAAIASVFSQAVAAIIVVTFLFRHKATIHIRTTHLRVKWDLAWRILKIGLPSAGQILSRNIVGLVLMAMVTRFGTAAVAAFGIGIRLHMLILMPAFTLGNSVAPIVGHNLGAGRPERAQTAAWLATLIDVAIMAGLAIPIYIFAPQIVAVFDKSPDVVAFGNDYLRLVTPFYIFACLAIVLGRALQGAGDTMFPMIATIVSMWGVQLPLAYLLPRYHATKLNIHGIWWAISIAMILHGIMIAAWFIAGKWKKKEI